MEKICQMCNFTYLEVLRGIKGRAFWTPTPPTSPVHAEGHTLTTRTSAAKSSDVLLMFPVQTHLLILSVPCDPVHEYQKQELRQGSASTKTRGDNILYARVCAALRRELNVKSFYMVTFLLKTNLLSVWIH